MAKKALKIVLSIFILSAVLLVSGFEAPQSAQAKKYSDSSEEKMSSENIEHKNCPDICYSPHLEADQYYINHLNPEKYENWTEEFDQGVVYNDKLRSKKSIEREHSKKEDGTHSSES